MTVTSHYRKIKRNFEDDSTGSCLIYGQLHGVSSDKLTSLMRPSAAARIVASLPVTDWLFYGWGSLSDKQDLFEHKSSSARDIYIN